VSVRREGALPIPATAVIAEDEAELGLELRDTLADLWPELRVCALVGDGVQAVRALDAHEPAVLFLDIEMPGMSGLEVARHASGRCHVVFVTAYDKYAVAAFDEGAVDYVMKPFEIARVAQTVKRLKARLENVPADLEGLLRTLRDRFGDGREHARWITASQGRELRLVTTDEICYFRADNKCTLVATADRELVIYRSIRELLESLDPAAFWQIHRGTIVNVNHIGGIARDFRGRLSVKLKRRPELLPVSAPYANRFRQM
jgi:DNA-binding LytR/AlgR family response regulator